MTPNQLYALPPVSSSREVYVLRQHVPEVEFGDIDSERNSRIEIRSYADHCYDGERIWLLASVWLDGKPVMVIAEAGRGGDDYDARYVTSPDRYAAMVEYLHSLRDIDPEELRDLVDPDQDFPEMTSFYSDRLERFYRPEGVAPRYKVGDVVHAHVLEHHLRDAYVSDPKRIVTCCRILAVHPFNPTRTYDALQIDRRFAAGWVAGTRPVIETAEGRGEIHATLREEDIVGPATS